jgi:hypothetical protein
MKLNLLSASLFVGLALNAWPATLPPEQLLPSDTLVMMSVPDYDQLRQLTQNLPELQLWWDPEMKAFKDKFLVKWQTNVVEPLEREMGIKFNDYANLLSGQLTIAITQNGWDGSTNKTPGFLMIMDVKDKTNALKTQLANLKKKWGDSGKPVKTEKIRDIEFTTLIVTEQDLTKTIRNVFPGLKKAASSDANKTQSTDKTEIMIGQSGALFLAGTVAKDLEKTLIRQTGGLVPTLAEQPVFEASQSQLRGSQILGWVNLQTLMDILKRTLTSAQSSNPPKNPIDLKPDKVISAVGLESLKSATFSYKNSPEGYQMEVALRVPEANRKGLFKLIALETKESQPPPFVPADAVKFSRFRLDLQKTWATLEGILAEISPEVSGLIQMSLQAVGKDQDPNFDFKKSLIGNLSNDMISYQKKPRTTTVEAFDSPPQVSLLSSANAEGLARAFKMLIGLLPPPANEVKEQEFLGRKIYSFVMPLSSSPGSTNAPNKIFFAASGGYLALSPEQAMIEEYLRSGESKPRSLTETAGLSEAAQKIGGMSTGMFGYENVLETTRAAWDVIKKDPDILQKSFAPSVGVLRADVMELGKELKEWFDLSLLPPFDKVAKYFHFAVYSGSVNSDGFSLKLFAPVPPLLKK